MRKIKFSLLITLAMFAISCNNEIPGSGVYFSTNIDTSTNIYTLYIDGVKQGILPYFDGIPEKQNKNELMYLSMGNGVHAMKITDKEGETTLEGDLKATSRTLLFTDNEGEIGIDTYVLFDQGGTAILHYTP